MPRPEMELLDDSLILPPIVLPGRKRGLSVWQNDGGQNDEDPPESGFECRLNTRHQPFTQRRGKPSSVKTGDGTALGCPKTG